jgi:hypothetical protein
MKVVSVGSTFGLTFLLLGAFALEVGGFRDRPLRDGDHSRNLSPVFVRFLALRGLVWSASSTSRVCAKSSVFWSYSEASSCQTSSIRLSTAIFVAQMMAKGIYIFYLRTAWACIQP